MNNFYIKMSPLTGMVGYGGGGTGLTFHADSGIPWYGGRAVAASGAQNWTQGNGVDSNKKVIEYCTIDSAGNSIDFGDLIEKHGAGSGTQGNGRMLIHSGIDHISIEYLAIATTGNSSDFGDSTAHTRMHTACSDGVRAVKLGGFGVSPAESEVYFDLIEYNTIDTTGNAQDHGGNLVSASRSMAGVSDGTKAIYSGGQRGSSTYVNEIAQVVIQTSANATDFGDLTYGRAVQCPGADANRAVKMGGRRDNVTTDQIDYFAMASNTNASDFGDLEQAMKDGQQGQVGNHSRALFMAGEDENTAGGAHNNKIQYVTVQTTGNGTDFGNLLGDDRSKCGAAGD